AMLQDWLPEDQLGRLRAADAATGLPREGARTAWLATALYYGGHTYFCWGDRTRAEGIWRQLAELANRTRYPGAIGQSMMADITLATADGRLEEVVELAGNLAALSKDQGSSRGGTDAFRALIYLGRADEALATAEQGAG